MRKILIFGLLLGLLLVGCGKETPQQSDEPQQVEDRLTEALEALSQAQSFRVTMTGELRTTGAEPITSSEEIPSIGPGQHINGVYGTSKICLDVFTAQDGTLTVLVQEGWFLDCSDIDYSYESMEPTDYSSQYTGSINEVLEDQTGVTLDGIIDGFKALAQMNSIWYDNSDGSFGLSVSAATAAQYVALVEAMGGEDLDEDDVAEVEEMFDMLTEVILGAKVDAQGNVSMVLEFVGYQQNGDAVTDLITRYTFSEINTLEEPEAPGLEG